MAHSFGPVPLEHLPNTDVGCFVLQKLYCYHFMTLWIPHTISYSPVLFYLFFRSPLGLQEAWWTHHNIGPCGEHPNDARTQATLSPTVRHDLLQFTPSCHLEHLGRLWNRLHRLGTNPSTWRLKVFKGGPGEIAQQLGALQRTGFGCQHPHGSSE